MSENPGTSGKDGTSGNDGTLGVPELSLIVLVGASGSGKSTFAARHFAPTRVLSSDRFLAMVADDENDQSATADAFETLRFVAGKRLAAGRTTVVDATNVQKHARQQWIELAREHDVLPVAIVLDLPESVCVDRNARRSDRDFGAHVVRKHRSNLRKSLKSLRREGFRRVHVLGSESEVESASIRFDKSLNDKRHDSGPFDVIGDVHGCREELEALLGQLGYEIRRDERDRAVDAAHPAGRRALLLGDLCLGWFHEMLDGSGLPAERLRTARGLVSHSFSELILGQYLDLDEQTARTLSGQRAETVIRYKTAKYTVERPMHLGVTRAAELLHGLRAAARRGLPAARRSARRLREPVGDRKVRSRRLAGRQAHRTRDAGPAR